MIVRKAAPEEQGRVDELFAIAFEQPLNRNNAPQCDDRAQWWSAFDEEGTMMSTLCVNDFIVRFDGHSCKMGGIGGVATLPQFRRRGGIRACFNEALPDMYREGYDFSYLYPFSTEYYRKFGYENCVQKYRATVDLGLLKAMKTDGYFRLAEASHPMRDEIRSLDKLWEEKFNMMVLHEDRDYGWTEKFDPAATGEFTYVCFDAGNTPRAYTTFRMVMEKDGRNLICSRFCFRDKEGFGGLMQLFKSLSSDHRYVRFDMPAIHATQYLFPEWSMGAAQWTVLPGGMVRVVNVRNVLNKARYVGTGCLALEVTDSQIPENNRRFAVSFENGTAASVTENAAEPDIVLTVPAFSTLIAGVWDFADAREWMSGLEIRNEGAPFEKIFYRKNMMLVDYF